MTEASVGIAGVPDAVAARKASSSTASTSSSSPSPSTAAAAATTTNQPQQQASALVHTAIGAVAGVVEVTIMQPTVAIKNALQAARPIPWSPLELYRGYAVNATSFAPITAIQFGANRFYEQALSSAGIAPGGVAGTLLAAGAAGATSTVVGNPSELLMIRQQQHRTSLVEEAKAVVRDYGVRGLYRGLSMALCRESLYAGCYLGVCPLLKARLDSIVEEKKRIAADASASSSSSLAPPSFFSAPPPGATLVASGACAGLLAAVLTQPLDTVKTRMQAYMDQPQYRSAPAAARAVAAAPCGAARALFAGLVPRGVRIVGATMILQAVRTALLGMIAARGVVEVEVE